MTLFQSLFLSPFILVVLNLVNISQKTFYSYFFLSFPKDAIDAAVKSLLALKAEYKTATGTEWKPDCVTPQTTGAAPSAASSTGMSAVDINNSIVAAGDKVRQLKSSKAPKVKTILYLGDFRFFCLIQEIICIV